MTLSSNVTQSSVLEVLVASAPEVLVVEQDGLTALELLVPGAAAAELLLVSDEVVTFLELVEQGPAGVGLPGPTGPAGSARVVQAVCDAALPAGMPLYQSRLTGHLLRADAALMQSAYVVGLASAPTAAGFVADALVDTISLADWSAVTGQNTLAVGQVYFLAVGGGLTTAPASSPSVNTLVGHADRADRLILKLQPPIQL
jgi:hypothetical protein